MGPEAPVTTATLPLREKNLRRDQLYVFKREFSSLHDIVRETWRRFGLRSHDEDIVDGGVKLEEYARRWLPGQIVVCLLARDLRVTFYDLIMADGITSERPVLIASVYCPRMRFLGLLRLSHADW